MDTPTDEWLEKFEWRLEPRDGDSDKVVVVRNLTPFALDRYRHRGELDDDALLNERMFQAGDRLRLDWELAGLTMMARSQVEAGRVEGSAVHFSDKRLAARERVQHAMVVLGPTRNIVVDCCVFGGPARRYLEVLRLGLRTLANHYGMP